MRTFLGLIFCAVIVAIIFLLMLWKRWVVKKVYAEYSEKDFSYTLFIKEENGAQVVHKIILNLGTLLSSFLPEDLLPAAFTVTVSSEYEGGTQTDCAHKERTVKNVFLSDIDGTRCEDTSAGHIVLELETDSSDGFCTPFIYDTMLLKKREKSVYSYTIAHKKFPSLLTLENKPFLFEDAQGHSTSQT